MTYIRSETVDILANSSGESTAFSPTLNGRVNAIEFVPGTLSSAAAVTVKGETSSRAILTVAALSTSPGLWFPRKVTNKIADGSTFGGEAQIPIAGERVRFVVSAGGNGGAASFRILMD